MGCETEGEVGLVRFEMFAYRLRSVVNRLFGIWCAVLGGIGLFAGVAGCVRWTVGVKDVPIERAVIQAALTGIVTLIGIAHLRRRPYRPDLGDKPFQGAFTRPREPRKWWTGDPK